MPMATPIRIVSTSATSGFPVLARSAKEAAVNPTMEPTERSIAPVVMTKVIAIATMTVGATWRNTFTRLLAVKKASAWTLKKMKSTPKTTLIDRTPKCRAMKSPRAPLPMRRSTPFPVVVVMALLPHHRVDELGQIGLGRLELAVAQSLVEDDEPVRDLEEVLQAVSDQHDADPALGPVPDQLEHHF